MREKRGSCLPAAGRGSSPRLREKKGLTQEDVAFKSGVSVYYISKLERGKANPSLETVHKIAKALGISILELVK